MLAFLPGLAQAQAYQCRVPSRIAAVPAPRMEGPARRAVIGRYSLALSWSPEFCRTRQRDGGHALQCSGAQGRFGFIVHGLWPEARRGAAPQWCSLNPRPSPAIIRSNLCMMPSPRLIEHEWAKHGSCMARRPEGYFKVAAILWNALRFPDMDRLSRDPQLTAGTLRQAFAAVNPGWRADAIAVETTRTGWLRELRLCYDHAFMPTACLRGQRGAGDRVRLKVWRGL
jgi:ribonuclease T2